MADIKKRVVRRATTRSKALSKDFAFTRDMLPSWSNGSKESNFVDQFRQEAWQNASKLALPKTNEEAWRRTDISKLAVEKFRIPTENDKSALPEIPKSLLKPIAGKGHGGQIVFSPKETQHQLSAEIKDQGVIFLTLREAAKSQRDLLEKVLGKIVRSDEGKFAALAAAFAEDGVFLYVPKGVQVEKPLHSVLWGPGDDLAYFSHLVVWLEEGASATYVHEAASPNGKNQSMHAGNVEIYVGENANLRFIEMQSWGDQIWNFSHERARVMKNGKIDWIFGSLGSHLTKNFSEINLEGEGSEGRMSGFYFTDKDQHLDHDTQQNHLAPRTSSDLLFKGALEDESRSVWQGMIYVAPEAQQTDGYQSNKNLVLSENARADSIPGLEILADDVRCTHGATIGNVDEEEMFYLLSRGIPKMEARQLIVEGFFDPIMQRIPFDGVRARFQQAIVQKMK